MKVDRSYPFKWNLALYRCVRPMTIYFFFCLKPCIYKALHFWKLTPIILPEHLHLWNQKTILSQMKCLLRCRTFAWTRQWSFWRYHCILQECNHQQTKHFSPFPNPHQMESCCRIFKRLQSLEPTHFVIVASPGSFMIRKTLLLCIHPLTCSIQQTKSTSRCSRAFLCGSSYRKLPQRTESSCAVVHTHQNICQESIRLPFNELWASAPASWAKRQTKRQSMFLSPWEDISFLSF